MMQVRQLHGLPVCDLCSWNKADPGDKPPASYPLFSFIYMAQKFKLIERRNLGKDSTANPKKFYAQAVNNGYVTFVELCVEIAESCTLTSADVKAVMDRMNYILDKNLKAGRIVQFGEIGNFRLAVGSTGSVVAKDFATSQIKNPKIMFTPGSKLRETRHLTTFEQEVVKQAEGENDRPDII